MHFSHEVILVLMSICFIAGFVDAIAGGSGLLVVPALLATGLPPQLTIGTNKFAASFGVLCSATTFIRRGIFNPLYWRAAILAVFIGALCGALATQLISSHVFRQLIPIAVIAVAVYMLIPKKSVTESASKTFRPRSSSSAILGTILGFYDGFLGPGTGSFWATLVMAVYKLDLLTASGVARFMNLISNTVALMTFILLGDVDYQLGIFLAIALAAGSYIGANAAIRFGVKFIKPVFLTVVIVLAIHMIYVEWMN